MNTDEYLELLMLKDFFRVPPIRQRDLSLVGLSVANVLIARLNMYGSYRLFLFRLAN